MRAPRRDPYAILGVPRHATRAEIATVFRGLAKRTHPDVGGQPAVDMRDLNWAWNLLSDPRRRASWDAAHPPTGAQSSHWSPPTASTGRPSGPPEADWRTPPPWTVSGEPWAGAGAPAVGRSASIGCVGMVLMALLLGAFVLYGALTSEFPQSVDEPSEPQTQATAAP